jgi:polygalacturonase
MRFIQTGLIFSLFAVSALQTMSGQDSRVVTEPRVPPACANLKAEISAPNGVIRPEDERKLDTDRIQKAIDSCSPSHAVMLSNEGNVNVFLSGPLLLRSGVTLVVDANTSLVGSRDPRLFDRAPNSCGILSERSKRSAGCKALISGEGIENSGVMGEGSIDGRGGAKLLGQEPTWWDLAYQAKIGNKRQSVYDLITIRHAKNITLYGITLRNALGTHVGLGGVEGFTAWGVKIMTPRSARNTDGIDPGSSRDVTITNCYINNGDDNVTFGSGSGEPVENVSVLHNHFYGGHGMSIGSGTAGGVSHMLVDDLTIDGADNGIRIKSDRSRGGLVHDITYRNVCMRNVNNPLAFLPFYTDVTGDLLPSFTDIHLENIRILTKGTYTFLGLDDQHKLGLTFNNVDAADLTHSTIQARNAEFAIVKSPGNLAPSGDGVTVRRIAESPRSIRFYCDGRFLPYPQLPQAPEMAGAPPPVDAMPYVGPGAK